MKLRHILKAGLFLTVETAEALSLRISDIIEYSPTKDAFIQSLGAHNIATLEELDSLYLYDFGIFLELQPDEEEKARLENNIQVALQQQTIDLEDAIDIREVRNVKQANQLLKVRRRKKIQRDQQLKERNIQAQAQANMQTQQAAAQSEMQKNQMQAQIEAQLEQQKSQLRLQEKQADMQMKQALMQQEFEYNMQLKNIETKGLGERDRMKEDRKDERTRIQATQQSQMIAQRKNEEAPKNFEQTGDDLFSGNSELQPVSFE